MSVITSREKAKFLVHHVFLPPKLPHEDDLKPECGKTLLTTTLGSLSRFRDYVSDLHRCIVDSAIAMMRTSNEIHEICGDYLSVSEEKLKNAFAKLCKEGGSVPVHIDAQNAGVVITKDKEHVHIEMFEVSPRNEDVLTTKGRLRRFFPASAISMELSVFGRLDFQRGLAHTLSKMSRQAAADAQPKAKKAGQLHDEDRDTTHPKMVTEFLATFLLAQGAKANTATIVKNTREEVLYRKTRQPWRRSPLWLFIRVTLQLLFCRSTADSDSLGILYKEFMVFLMADVLSGCHEYELESDIFLAMNAKLHCRVLKMETSNERLLQFAHEAMNRTNDILESTWSGIQLQNTCTLPLSILSSLDFETDSFTQLPSLDKFIDAMDQRHASRTQVTFAPAYAFAKYEPDELPSLSFGAGEDCAVQSLIAFETWVATCLDGWLLVHRDDSSTCGKLGSLIEDYHSKATIVYTGNPESISIMVLTLMELWVACDVSATQIFPILTDYDPGLPHDTLQNLVLPLKSHMERLHHVEDYLITRTHRSKFRSPHIFTAFGTTDSFAVRHFENSQQHQALLANIELAANEARRKKCEELRQKRDQYDQLMKLSQQVSCQYSYELDPYDGSYEKRHRNDCQKCNYLSRANSLKIHIHEWPLPANLLQARSTVFELQVPQSFGNWRDVTAFLLIDVLKMTYESKRPQHGYTPHTYQGLCSYAISFTSQQRIGLLSEAKPHEVTHRRDKPVSTSIERDICLNNGLKYQYCDGKANYFTCEISQTHVLPKVCTYKLPNGSPLQQFLFRPADNPSGPSPNTAIATQSSCPDHISLEEYRALCNIPLGYRIQWQNILVQLHAPAIDFKKIESELIMLQCVRQAGPRLENNVLRAGHIILEDIEFANPLIDGFYDVSNRLKQNWQAASAFGVLAVMAVRLLSLSHSEDIKKRCLGFLSSARTITLDWANGLKDKIQMSTDDDMRDRFRSKAVYVALICGGTFDVDDEILERLLELPECASIFLQCSIIIQEGALSIKQTEGSITLLHRRWQRLCHRSYHILAHQIVERSCTALDDAVKMSWQAYDGNGNWHVLSQEHDSWLINEVAGEGHDKALQLQFNLLSGELLVNGIPLNRLPTEYERHPMYRKLFGRSAIEVMPSTVPGMQFSGKRKYAGYAIHFGMLHSNPSGSDLLVRAIGDRGEFELVPARAFHNNFPAPLAGEHIHWYDLASKCVEFRPQNDPWAQSENTWKLRTAGPERVWRLDKDSQCMLSVNSRTGKVVAQIFNPLEDPLWIQAVLNQSTSALDIELPRLQLGFRLDPGGSLIKSKQYRGMSLDENQSLGTLVGLQSKLVLRDVASPTKRMLVIPEGKISFYRERGHTRVHINADTAVKAQAYRVDNELGRLVDNGNLQSKLFLAYLHALTSFCLPDVLTRRTGTEQSLSILDSAAIRSFSTLTEGNIDMLENIASLTPGRKFYPEHERVMQTVSWSTGLGFGAQHSAFFTIIRRIFAYATTTKFFYTDKWVELPSLNQVDMGLLERDDIRSSTFRVSGYGAEGHSTNHDRVYVSRDRWQESRRVLNVFGITNAVFNNSLAFHIPVPGNIESYLWEVLSHCDEIFGPNHHMTSELAYDGQWLLKSNFVHEHWAALHQKIKSGFEQIDKFKLMIWLSTLAFAGHTDMLTLYTLAAFAIVPEVAQLSPPSTNSFCLKLKNGAVLKPVELSQILMSGSRPFHRCPEAAVQRRRGESKCAFHKRQQEQFQNRQNRALDALTQSLIVQWPCEEPEEPVDTQCTGWAEYFDMSNTMAATNRMFKSWFDNYCFKQYLGRIGASLPRQLVQLELPRPALEATEWNLPRTRRHISADEVFYCSPPTVAHTDGSNLSWLLTSETLGDKQALRLVELIAKLGCSSRSSFEKRYVGQLEQSLKALENHRYRAYQLRPIETSLQPLIVNYVSHRREQVYEIYCAMLEKVLGVTITDTRTCNVSRESVPGIYQWPRLSPVFFLQYLRRKKWQGLSSGWQDCLVRYGLALTQLQQAERLLACAGNATKFIEELQNPGHTNWSAHDHPESLLLEVESGIMIREVQERIAAEMRAPSSGKNAVMQLNMGEGKSSVIVPMVAAALADGDRLVRVIVAKPQAKQMLDMLVAKLGGLLDRQVFHMPFSRAVKLRAMEAKAVHDIHQGCMAAGGVLLVQPEHVLSFKLMAIDRVISEKTAVGRSLLRSQEFLTRSCRDIVDESDENFNVKFELVYTMGMQRPIDHSPERWVCIQRLLSIFRSCVMSVKAEYPDSIEIHPGPGGCFPRTRILRQDAQERILVRIANQVCKTGLSGFPIAREPQPVRDAVITYITKQRLNQSDRNSVEASGQQGFWGETTKSTLLLLRGLLAEGVLAFASRRSGGELTMVLLLADYQRQDLQCHIELKITQARGYYYGGLKDNELFLAFSHLRESDQADLEYQEWVKDSNNLPTAFSQLDGVNLEDHSQCIEEIFPRLRFAKGAIDYYLAHLVFPKEMKEFPHKLSASGWDIGEVKDHATTGFSGTNDSRSVLPLAVEQLDLEDQKHTNALVLEYLLQPENSVVVMKQKNGIDESDAERLLSMVMKMEKTIRVIIDVGAQILELDNMGVARQWLKMLPDHERNQAVIFFDDSDNLCVLDRKGRVESLHTSSFAEQLDVCVVFLDEAHTRGTDLRLPDDYRAAVTLGANLTKDRLIQACMRMRRLGKGQSVVFCVPDEIRSKIQAFSSKITSSPIEVSDILAWAISETWMDARRSMPLWAIQGKRYLHQQRLWAGSRTENDGHLSKDLANAFLEDEAQTLDTRYRPHVAEDRYLFTEEPESLEMGQILHRSREFDAPDDLQATFREEQERELSPEAEQERQVQKPQAAEPRPHQVHDDIVEFVQSGVVRNNSKAYMPAFEALSNTSAAVRLEIMADSRRRLYVSADFAHTVKIQGKSVVMDSYQRPVQWILTTPRRVLGNGSLNFMMIISPFEAQELLPNIMTSQHVALHLYAPRPNLGYRPLDSLDLYTAPEKPESQIPRPVIVELNIFAGQLYFKSYQEYTEACEFLGFAWQYADEGCILSSGSTVVQASQQDGSVRPYFHGNSVKFLKALMTKIRRDCESIDKTHMGHILDNRLLMPGDF